MIENVFFWNWEPVLMEWLQNHMGEAGIRIASVLTTLGEETALILILGFIYWCYDKNFGKFLGTNIVVAIVLNPMLKNIVFRTRPYFNHSKIRCLKPVNAAADIYDISAQGYSFPSGHATNASVVFGSIAMKTKRKLWIVSGILIPVLVALSRVMLGVHYPTDVLAGLILGYGIAGLLSWIQSKISRRWMLHLILFLLVLPGCIYCKTADYYTALGTMAGAFLAMPFEERFVRFENTRKVSVSILRVAGGIAVYLVLNRLLKLPFSKEFLDSGAFPALLIRTVRYAVVVFVMLAVYPFCFRFGRKKSKESSNEKNKGE